MENDNSKTDSRRQFIKKISTGGILAASGLALGSLSSCKEKSTEKTTLLTTDGKLVQVPNSEIEGMEHLHTAAPPMEARQGIPGKKWVMVVDLSKCKNAKKCVEACDKHHNLTPDRPYIKVLEMKDNEKSSPYWMPKKCFQCDNPPCVKVCPVGQVKLELLQNAIFVQICFAIINFRIVCLLVLMESFILVTKLMTQ